MLELNYKKNHVDAKEPTRSYDSIGYDLYSIEDKWLFPFFHRKIDTGITFEILPEYGGFIWDRSSFGIRGIHRLAGVIDPDFRGSVKVVLMNLFPWIRKVKKGDKIAQIVFQKVEIPKLNEKLELNKTKRDAKGFGSTG